MKEKTAILEISNFGKRIEQRNGLCCFVLHCINLCMLTVKNHREIIGGSVHYKEGQVVSRSKLTNSQEKVHR
jgi:hypothetical protein